MDVDNMYKKRHNGIHVLMVTTIDRKTILNKKRK